MDTFDIAKQAAASDAFCCESLFISYPIGYLCSFLPRMRRWLQVTPVSLVMLGEFLTWTELVGS